jgi:hypothetical protein
VRRPHYKLKARNALLKRSPPKLFAHVAIRAGHYFFQRNRRGRQSAQAGLKRELVNLQRSCALECFDHPGGTTGMLVKDYRGKNEEQEVWSSTRPLGAKILHTLKQGGHRGRAVDDSRSPERRESPKCFVAEQ